MWSGNLHIEHVKHSVVFPHNVLQRGYNAQKRDRTWTERVYYVVLGFSYVVVRYDTLWYVTIRCGTLRYVVVRYDTLWYITIRCGMLRYVVVRCVAWPLRDITRHNVAQRGTTWHNVAQRGTTWHNVAQRGTTWHNVAQRDDNDAIAWRQRGITRLWFSKRD